MNQCMKELILEFEFSPCIVIAERGNSSYSSTSTTCTSRNPVGAGTSNENAESQSVNCLQVDGFESSRTEQYDIMVACRQFLNVAPLVLPLWVCFELVEYCGVEDHRLE